MSSINLIFGATFQDGTYTVQYMLDRGKVIFGAITSISNFNWRLMSKKMILDSIYI